jgi:hypothetical protein
VNLALRRAVCDDAETERSRAQTEGAGDGDTSQDGQGRREERHRDADDQERDPRRSHREESDGQYCGDGEQACGRDGDPTGRVETVSHRDCPYPFRAEKYYLKYISVGSVTESRFCNSIDIHDSQSGLDRCGIVSAVTSRPDRLGADGQGRRPSANRPATVTSTPSASSR